MIQKENIKPIIVLFSKIGCLLITLFIIILLLNPLFIPKHYEEWSNTSVIDGFYALENNTIDVFILGSSQVMSAISPMQIYEKTGITCYNLGTEQQSLFLSYYFLKEILCYQQPSVVILDLFFLYPRHPEFSLNSRPELFYKSFDYMRWSHNKLDATINVVPLNDGYRFRDLLFPIFRYHSRWSELSTTDFVYYTKDKTNPLKGFYYTTTTTPTEFFGYEYDETIPNANPQPVMLEYFDKIVQLCNENNISLILIKTPRDGTDFSHAQSNSMLALAQYYNLPLLDFNESTLYNTIDFDSQTDYRDFGHINYSGAVKITSYLSDYLKSHYILEDKRNNPAYDNWNEDLKKYQEIIRQDTVSN